MSDTTLEIGDRVRTVNMPSEFQRSLGTEPSEHEGEVVDIVDERAVIETEDGDEKRVHVDYVDAEIDSDGGVTIQVI